MIIFSKKEMNTPSTYGVNLAIAATLVSLKFVLRKILMELMKQN